jgi:hypothetical protein
MRISDAGSSVRLLLLMSSILLTANEYANAQLSGADSAASKRVLQVQVEVSVAAKDQQETVKDTEKPAALEKKSAIPESAEPVVPLPGDKGPNLDPGNARNPLIPDGLRDPLAPKSAIQPRDRKAPLKKKSDTEVEPPAAPADAADKRALPLSPILPNGNSTRGLRWLENGLLNERAARTNNVPRWFDSPLSDDPLVRASAFSVVTRAESLLDGLGAVPAPRGTGLDGALIPPGARIFRIGPVTLRGGVNLGGTYRHGTRPNTAGQSGASANSESSKQPSASAGPVASGDTGSTREKSNRTSSTNREGSTNSGRSAGEIEPFSFQSGLSLDFVLGEPATGHFMVASYGLSFDTALLNDEQGGQGSPVTQSLALLGRLDFAKLKLGMGITFDSLSGQNRDQGGAAERNLFGISLNASYPIGAKTTLDWDITVPIKQVEGGVGTTSFTTSNSINYQYSPKLSLGGGYAFKIHQSKVDDEARNRTADSETADDQQVDEQAATATTKGAQSSSPAKNRSEPSQSFGRSAGSETSHTVFLRAGFQASPKLSFGGNVGLEFTEYEQGNSISPVLAWDVTWKARPKTSISLSIEESLQQSAAGIGESFLSSAVILSLNQQLGNRTNVTLILGYEHAVYQTMGETQDDGRVDDLLTGQISLSIALSSRWSASLVVSYADNRSSDEAFRFTSTQVQIQTSFAF